MIKCEVLVIGAGPAGSAAAIVLARSGLDVLLAERYEFPRDKICGDALIPDSLAAVAKLNLAEELKKRSYVASGLKVFSPNGTEVLVRGQFACQPRAQFDAMLQQAALAAGVTFLAPFKVAGPRLHGGRVEGARLTNSKTGDSVDIEARVTLLATGAAAKPLQLFGVCTRESASAMAARAYFQLPDDLADESRALVISYDKAICPGYGWIFPGPGNVFNVGVGVFMEGRRRAPVPNLRRLWELFLSEFPMAARISARGTRLTPLKGAPLRTALQGARFHRPGLLVIGEAAGLTFSFSGEGIGKAMESGLIAGELVRDSLAEGGSADGLGAKYEAVVRERFSSIFSSYRLVQDCLAWPSVCNFLARRANRSPYVIRQLEGMLSESVDPSALFSLSGLVKSLYR